MNLYELTRQYALLRHYSTDTNSEYEPGELEAELDKLQDSIEVKLANICGWVKSEQSEIDAIEAEIKILKKKRDWKQNDIDRLKKYTGHILGDGERWSNGIHSLSWRKSSRVEPTEDNPEAKTVEQYARVKTIIEPDKVLMKEDLVCGAKIPGWHLVEEMNLQVK